LPLPDTRLLVFGAGFAMTDKPKNLPVVNLVDYCGVCASVGYGR
jgi:hypothetical protein